MVKAALLLCVHCAVGRTNAVAPDIIFSSSPTALIYSKVRWLSQSADPIASSDIKGCVELLNQIDAEIPERITFNGRLVPGKQIVWQIIDGAAFDPGVKETPHIFDDVPAKVGDFEMPKQLLSDLAGKLSINLGTYMKFNSPELNSLKAAHEYWESSVKHKLDPAYLWLIKGFGFSETPKEIRVVVVPDLIGKGGVTYKSAGGAFCVVGTNQYKDADFAECVIHETIHALDANSKDSIFFGVLRTSLTNLKVDPFTLQQVPHTAIFMSAGEAVRRFIDPKHEDLGIRLGVYSGKVEGYRKMMADIMTRMWDGTTDPADCGAMIAQAVTRHID